MELKVWIILAATTLCYQLAEQAEEDSIELSTTAEPVPATVTLNHSVAYNVNDFGYKLLLKMMNDKKNENIVISPTGIAGLLAMILLGSVGRTYDEIAEALGFSQDIFANRKSHEQLGELLKSLNSNVSSKTLYADALFVDAQTPLRELYRKYLNDVYNGEILGADFKQLEEARAVINQWVSSHTEGQIENFLEHSLPPATKLVSLSALYFKGQWEKPFNANFTLRMPFKRPTDEVVTDLMLNWGNFPYKTSVKHNLIMIALPYNDSETTMYAIKPIFPKKKSLLDLMERIDYKKIDDVISELHSSKCIVRFPKMELKSKVDLENTLKAIGIRDMFSQGKANFALMVNGNSIVNKTEEELINRINSEEDKIDESRSIKDRLDSLPNPGLHVDSVMHDVKISINEYGTEAVAATSALIARTAELFYADSPFYMFIRNERTKLVTFSAVIFDPTAK